MVLIISDLPSIFNNQFKSCEVIEQNDTINKCNGCFKCWTKTPGRCIQRDTYSLTGSKLAKCNELYIISKNYFGALSPFVKNVFDRSISYVHPDFVIRNGEMHHKRRYENVIDVSAYFYGDNITNNEKETLIETVRANCVNFDGRLKKVDFKNDSQSILEEIAL